MSTCPQAAALTLLFLSTTPFFPSVTTAWVFGNLPDLTRLGDKAEDIMTLPISSLSLGSDSMFPTLLCHQEEDDTSNESDEYFEEPINGNGKRSRPFQHFFNHGLEIIIKRRVALHVTCEAITSRLRRPPLPL